MRWDQLESLEPRVLLAVLSDAAAVIPGVRGNQAQYADFNDDGIIDAIGRASNGWTVDFGRADGAFEPGRAAPVIGAPRFLYAERVVLGRWTPGDDSVDIAIIRNINKQWSVRLFSNNGAGVFTPRPRQSISGVNLDLYRATLGEVQRGETQASDLLWFYSGRLRSLSFDAAGAVVSDAIVSTGVRQWSRADFDRDGDDELLISRTLGDAAGPATVQVARRGGDDAWTFTTILEGSDAQRDLHAGDLDGDDRPDVGWAHGQNVTIIRNTTLPDAAEITFAPPAPFITVHPDSPPDAGYFTDANRSRIIDSGRIDDGQPPAVIVQTYRAVFGRIPTAEIANHLLRPAGDDQNRMWSIRRLSGGSGDAGGIDRTSAEQFIDIGGDSRNDVVLGRQAWRNILEADIRRPTIGGLRVGPLDPELGVRTLVATDLRDPDGSVTSVRFYHDSDGDGQWSPSDYALPARVTTSPDGARRIRLGPDHEYSGPGPTRFFARAWDDKGFVGAPTAFDLIIPGPLHLSRQRPSISRRALRSPAPRSPQPTPPSPSPPPTSPATAAPTSFGSIAARSATIAWCCWSACSPRRNGPTMSASPRPGSSPRMTWCMAWIPVAPSSAASHPAPNSTSPSCAPAATACTRWCC